MILQDAIETFMLVFCVVVLPRTVADITWQESTEESLRYLSLQWGPCPPHLPESCCASSMKALSIDRPFLDYSLVKCLLGKNAPLDCEDPICSGLVDSIPWGKHIP